MRSRARLVLFGVGLAVIFVAAIGVGSVVEPADTEPGSTHAESTHDMESTDHTKGEGQMNGHGGHDEVSPAPAGLGVAEGGHALRLHPAFVEVGQAVELRFSISDSAGRTVTAFDELHDRRMHLIIVRRDGTGFRHLHPEMDGAGTWTTATSFAEAGAYRVFADFSTGGSSRTLATDLFASGGHFQARPFPEPRSSYETDGYEIGLDSDRVVAGETSSLSFTVEQNGESVDDLAPYLGAKGHLVALREGDLAFLHVHPEEAGHGGSEDGVHGHGGGDHGDAETAGNEIAFGATFPTSGRYRLYLQFKHHGAVRTAEFTVSVQQ